MLAYIAYSIKTNNTQWFWFSVSDRGTPDKTCVKTMVLKQNMTDLHQGLQGRLWDVEHFNIIIIQNISI